MKKQIHFIGFVLMLLVMAAGFAGCKDKYEMTISSQDVRFGMEAGTQTLILKANCKWTINKDDNDDWFTVSPMSGEPTDSIITVTVDECTQGDYRGAYFFVESPGGHVFRRVFVSQNKVDFYSMINKVYGATSIEHWNTDYFNQIIEDTYHHWVYDPFDTTQGQQMYFLEDGTGIQCNKVLHDEPLYFPFTYEFDPVNNTLHIEFELVDGSPEPYDPEILHASDSIYRFYHEYKAHWHERAEMRKIGVVDPNAKALLKQKLTKRKGGEPIFIQE